VPSYYPVFIDVVDRTCVVIGGGKIGEEKVRKLLESGAKVSIISPEVTDGVRGLVASDGEKVTWAQREYQRGDLKDAFIAIAATDDTRVNTQISEEANERNVLLNVVDVTHLCTFIAPSVARRGEVTIAVSTGGASPALARKFREELTASTLIEYADLAPLLSVARNELKEMGVKVAPDHWQTCITDDLLTMVQDGKDEEAKKTLMADLLNGKVAASVSS
jgi:precorrin-2 dehydrogenase/sirohydrochlorin ferrochelatase